MVLLIARHGTLVVIMRFNQKFRHWPFKEITHLGNPYVLMAVRIAEKGR